MDGYQKAVERIELAKKNNLQSLNLRGLGLKTLPNSISSLQNLTKLDLSINKLRALPESILSLQNISELFLFSNELSVISDEISSLYNLRHLSLDNNQLKTLPEGISLLENLTILSLGNNQLKTLPESISLLENLTILNLSNNKVLFANKIPLPKNIINLNLSSNDLKKLPKNILSLNNLKQLTLGNNSSIGLPKEISSLKNLTSLYVHYNQFTIFPENILLLPKLEVLLISNNKIKSLPENLSSLKNLSSLNLKDNQLSSLPNSILELQNLSNLYLENNQLEVGPEVWKLPIKEQTQEILKWQKAKTDNELRPIHEAKAIFIGESNFGKTHLIELLREKEIKRTITTTHGIERSKLQIPYQDDTIDLNIWDLGGQEFMRNTHQFFFSERTLYVIVTLARLERKGLIYWLELANKLGNNPPIIIVTHKIDDDPHSIDSRGLKRDYPNIVDFVRTSIHDCDEKKALDGINDLYIKISSTVTNKDLMPSVFYEQRPEWFTIKKELENLKDDYITYTEYRKLEHVKDLPSKEQRRNLKLLSILGTVVSYIDNSRLLSTHVINPQWIVDGVYKIINDKIIKDKQKGEFNIKELLRILPEERFPLEEHNFILKLMGEFKVCYQAETDKDIYFIPDLFEDVEPENKKWEDVNLSFRFNYKQYPPNTFMTSFIVKKHESIINNLRWRNGLYITNNSCHAKVYQSFRENCINIEVKGNPNECRSYLYHIREEFRKSHRPFPKMQITQEVLYKGYWLDYEYLLYLEMEGEKTYLHKELRERIPVSEVLNGYASPQERDKYLEQFEILNRKNDESIKEIKKVKGIVTKIESLLVFSLIEVDTIHYPNIFTLKPKRISIRNQSDFNTLYELQLYCFNGEKVGKPYEISIPKDWIKQLIPYYNGMLKGLKLVSGVALAVGFGVLSVDAFTDNKQNIKAAQNTIDKSSNIDETTDVRAYQPRPATGAEMVIIKNILDKADPNQSWKNDLHKVEKDGKIIWVCSKHR